MHTHIHHTYWHTHRHPQRQQGHTHLHNQTQTFTGTKTYTSNYTHIAENWYKHTDEHSQVYHIKRRYIHTQMPFTHQHLKGISNYTYLQVHSYKAPF